MNQRDGVGPNRLLAASFAAVTVAASCCWSALAQERNGMVLIPSRKGVVGTSTAQREELAKRFDCHPTWLGDDITRHEVQLPAFWIDRHPVTNAQYLAFVEATGHVRPSWWARWGGVFPAEYADHPVVGVSGQDAIAYSLWVGKRLPSAEEWECAAGNREGAVFAWGNTWPGPLKLRREPRASWELPGTRPVGSGDCGRSATGVEDFAGQTLEWASDIRPHHGVQFQLMKGASWFHEDPLSYRTASGWYAYEGWRSGFTGFRCALDGKQEPPPARKSQSGKTVSTRAAREQFAAAPTPGPITLNAAGGTSRHLSIRVPRFGPEALSLSAPETIIWNGNGVMTWRKTPDMTWTVQTSTKAAYEMRFDELRVESLFLAGDDCVQQRFTAVNLVQRAGSFHTSSCFNLQSHPQFYDCEQLRTYALDATGKFVPLRRLSRGGDCVRWITGPSLTELGDRVPCAVLAVVSRDGRSVIASGRAGENASFSVATNAMFTCLHTDSTVQVPGAGQVTTQQFFWFLDGSLDDLLRRASRDLKLQIPGPGNS
jgi:formylglycine-generating enzyme required for sulfatase activity